MQYYTEKNSIFPKKRGFSLILCQKCEITSKKLDFSLFLCKKYDVPLENFDFFPKKEVFHRFYVKNAILYGKNSIFSQKTGFFIDFMCKMRDYIEKTGFFHCFYVKISI